MIFYGVLTHMSYVSFFTFVDHKPDKRIRYNRLRPQWHRPYYPSADPEIGRGGGSSAGGGGGGVSSSKSYQDCLNGNCGEDGEVVAGGIDPSYYNNKDFDNFINSDSDYEDGDSDAEDFEDDFTTTDEDDDSDLGKAKKNMYKIFKKCNFARDKVGLSMEDMNIMCVIGA